ncbi:hypothetical protein JKA74_07305 [Marivirga sp. S37H4]|uniref:Uncharacterized protein n=1 Tax=Marivirga aurantiaca TaxID=2802615 RepID=A0A935CAJ4_9BACT|nr:hypothetical protein [Marivirga aurantiaca]MBK6264838.1 hypothetical protein [Marivirga aurantiaca]
MESNRIDEIFKDKLERHSLKVSDQAWSQLRSQMKSEKKHQPKFWMVAASASILILFSLGLGYNLMNKPTTISGKKVELRNSQNFTAQTHIPSQPQVIGKAHSEALEANRVENNQKSNSAPSVKRFQKEEKVEEVFRPQPLEKISGMEARLAIQTDEIKIVRFPGNERESDIQIEIYYEQQLVGSRIDETRNSLNKSANKLKSLASEISLADLRSAKNELFASAFQANKRTLNN